MPGGCEQAAPGLNSLQSPRAAPSCGPGVPQQLQHTAIEARAAPATPRDVVERVPSGGAAPPLAARTVPQPWALGATPRVAARSPPPLVNDVHDRFVWPLALLIYAGYVLKLVPLLAWHETAQSLGLLCGLAALAVTSRRFPGLYRRHGAKLRLALLTYGYTMPLLTSMDAMHAFSPAPSEVRYLGPLVDVYSLWLSSRNAFLGWAVLVCHPPLHLAVPFQAFGLWRITRAGFCRSPMMRHPVVVARTERVHQLLHMLSYLTSGPSSAGALSSLIPAGPELRCRSLLLFLNVLFAGLVPLLLLVPLSRGAAARSGAATRGSLGERLDAWIERRLRWLLWPSAEQQRGAGAPPESAPAALAVLMLRWSVALAVLWAACCTLDG